MFEYNFIICLIFALNFYIYFSLFILKNNKHKNEYFNVNKKWIIYKKNIKLFIGKIYWENKEYIIL